jgi:hypothetical protein
MNKLDELEQQARASGKSSDLLRWTDELFRSKGLYTPDVKLQNGVTNPDPTINVTFLRYPRKEQEKPKE